MLLETDKLIKLVYGFKLWQLVIQTMVVGREAKALESRIQGLDFEIWRFSFKFLVK